jgi:uncharacterized protein YcfL
MKNYNSRFNKKLKILILISILITFIFMLFVLSSCSSNTSGSTASQANDTQNNSTGKSESAVQEEVVNSVKGEDLTDYDNVKAGAEIKGAIPGFLCTNKDNIIPLEIKNTSDFTWRNDSKNSVRVGYHYYGQDVDASDYDSTTRTELDKNVAPGETIKVNMIINDIKKPGNYVIQVDLVLEGKYWFSSKGVTMIESPVYFGECKN